MPYCYSCKWHNNTKLGYSSAFSEPRRWNYNMMYGGGWSAGRGGGSHRGVPTPWNDREPAGRDPSWWGKNTSSNPAVRLRGKRGRWLPVGAPRPAEYSEVSLRMAELRRVAFSTGLAALSVPDTSGTRHCVPCHDCRHWLESSTIHYGSRGRSRSQGDGQDPFSWITCERTPVAVIIYCHLMVFALLYRKSIVTKMAKVKKVSLRSLGAVRVVLAAPQAQLPADHRRSQGFHALNNEVTVTSILSSLHRFCMDHKELIHPSASRAYLSTVHR